ncbi:DUF4239 domain-containing protein [Streptomyces sp. SL13]|uniref:DUF4239 domain-containing protein n=1 Tax=Streptantibioticus silvisoli TaxID=2705255 RepID=A0AA90H4T4_9ACTN|nr:DUF4239 domain-containing protein [Streptantibioticus silvisoli]MDI5967637.1 DUF4239 domain-containing protein [Streptantibioticus silvisoli]MDI5971976.1 DUF4239 domain-containing protein [Streptantibioticus silvisoli]
MSSLPATLGIVVACALLGVVVVLLKHKFFPTKPDDESDAEPADYIAMMISVIYALVLGLALVAVYGTNSDAATDVQTEAGALHQVYLLADALPPASEAQVRSTTDAYAHYVTTVEWKRMADHQSLGPEGWTLLNKLRDIYQSAPTNKPAEQNASQEALSQISTLDEARMGREQDGESTMSPVLWIGLYIGGALTVGFMFAFGVKRRASHLIMVMCLSGFIVFMILLIYQLDQPFSGILSVGTGDFGSYFNNT